MSDATSFMDGGPSYSLFFEIAVAVGTTVLAMFLCKNRRQNAALPSAESEKLKIDGEYTRKHDANETKIRNKRTGRIAQENDRDNEKSPAQDSKTTVPSHKAFATATTQTELPPMDERITWKAIVVNPWENPKRRYRSEIYVNVDGAVTHSESFRSEGVVGEGMKQILAKVQ